MKTDIITELLANLPLICLTLAFLIVLVCCIYNFFNMPRQAQIETLQEWLKWAVIQAEKELGGGTGKAKLHFAYDMAIKQFPWITKLVTFEVFSVYVDDALMWLKNQLMNNEKIETYVKGE